MIVLLSLLRCCHSVDVHCYLCSGVAIHSSLQILFHCCFVQVIVFLLPSALVLLVVVFTQVLRSLLPYAYLCVTVSA